jgi:predicted NBD/HSP70 family sugar kinase
LYVCGSATTGHAPSSKSAASAPGTSARSTRHPLSSAIDVRGAACASSAGSNSIATMTILRMDLSFMGLAWHCGAMEVVIPFGEASLGPRRALMLKCLRRFTSFNDLTNLRLFVNQQQNSRRGAVPLEATGNQQLLKDINRMTLVRHLCASPGLSRADLAVAVGLTKSTVSLLVRELIEEGWLVEREVVATGDLGRRPTPLFIDPSRLLMLGAEVGIDSVRVVATSLTGDVVANAVAGYGTAKSAKACIGTLAATLLKVRKQLDRGEHRFIGIGIGLPGGVDESSGFLHFAPNLAWRDVPVGALLAEKFVGTSLAGIPLFLQNEADVAALGELEFNPARGADPLLYLSINQGVGAGVIVSDRLLTGARGFAGEVGHMVLQINGPLCSCGRRGCAEALIGPRAMLRGDGDEPAAHSMAEIRQRLAAEDAETMRAVKKAGNYLGVLLQNLASAYDPGCIVLGGAVVDLGDVFLQPARRAFEEYLGAAQLTPPVVQTSRFGADAVAVGAAGLVRYRLTRPLMHAASAAAGVEEAA